MAGTLAESQAYADQATLAQELYDARDKTVQQTADLFGMPRSTVYGHLDRTTTVPRQPKKTAARPCRPSARVRVTRGKVTGE
jgi:hypothetical protein